jgi:hypothetical protein
MNSIAIRTIQHFFMVILRFSDVDVSRLWEWLPAIMPSRQDAASREKIRSYLKPNYYLVCHSRKYTQITPTDFDRFFLVVLLQL